MIEKLPVLRTLAERGAALRRGPRTPAPTTRITISGAQSYESLYTMNGVVLNENLRGQPFDLYIEDAILETTTITSSASAEFGRFAGGVVNMVTKIGRQRVLGLLPGQHGQRELEWRDPAHHQPGGHEQLHLRGHLWRLHRARRAVVLPRRSRPDLTFSSQIFDPGRGRRAVPKQPVRDPPRGPADRLDRPQPPPHLRLHRPRRRGHQLRLSLAALGRLRLGRPVAHHYPTRAGT